MKSAEAVAGEIDIPCQCCCGDGYICTPHKNIALALRAARAGVWEEVRKMIFDAPEGQDAAYILNTVYIRARLSEPPRGPGQGEEGR